jgi:hypothetical protein
MAASRSARSESIFQLLNIDVLDFEGLPWEIDVTIEGLEDKARLLNVEVLESHLGSFKRTLSYVWQRGSRNTSETIHHSVPRRNKQHNPPKLGT